MPGNANGSLDGIALKPLTVAFHEPGFIARLQAENQQPFWFMMSGEQRQRDGNPMGPANPQALNRYSYVQNNPLKYTDPGGHIACPAGFAGGPVVGLLVCAAVVLAPLAIYVGFEVHDHAQQHQETAGNTAPIPPAPTPEPGQGDGVQTFSHTLYNKRGVRIDVENPNPAQRPGQVHVQIGREKYIYDATTGTFRGAPPRVQRLLDDPEIARAVQRGVQKYLGIQEWKP